MKPMVYMQSNIVRLLSMTMVILACFNVTRYTGLMRMVILRGAVNIRATVVSTQKL